MYYYYIISQKKSVTYIVTTRLNGGGQIDDSYNKLTDETSAYNSRCLETSIVEVGIWHEKPDHWYLVWLQKSTTFTSLGQT